MPMKNKIRQFVDNQQITVYQFIKETGIATGTGYKLYNNPDHQPSSAVLDIICETYEIQPCELIEWVRPTEVTSNQRKDKKRSTKVKTSKHE